MNKPGVVIGFKNGLVSSVEAVKDLVDIAQKPMGEAQRRHQAQTKTPRLALHPAEVPPSITTETASYLSAIGDARYPVPRYLSHDETITGIPVPKRLPKESYLITMLEWDLRPGDSRVEAFFVGSGCRSRHWFLMTRTVNDLEPWRTYFVGGRTVAMMDKKGVTPEAAAVLLLKSFWEYERDHNGLHAFLLVDDEGLLDRDAVEQLASLVWPEEVEL